MMKVSVQVLYLACLLRGVSCSCPLGLAEPAEANGETGRKLTGLRNRLKDQIKIQVDTGKKQGTNKGGDDGSNKKGPSFQLGNVRSVVGTDRPDGKGQAGTTLMRMCPAKYPDTWGDQIRTDPNPRTISNHVVTQPKANMPNNRGMTGFVWQWGQFLDHDMDATDSGPAFGEAHMEVQESDDLFWKAGCTHVNQVRAAYAGAGSTSRKLAPRDQINSITSFIDSSNVYGSDDVRHQSLRSFNGGSLRSSANGLLLPMNDGNPPMRNAANSAIASDFFLAGDVRANEQLGLTAMHTLFMREHNRLAREIRRRFRDKWGQDLSDEDTFQVARKIVMAESQIVTYREFLPALLGPWAPKLEDYKGFDMKVDPSVANEFSTVVYRFGHSMIGPDHRLSNGKTMLLRDAFFNPEIFIDDPSNIEAVLDGLLTATSQEIDPFITTELQNFLFSVDQETSCLDLAALNIQRGRDHGLPPYNQMRQDLGLKPKPSWGDVTSNKDLQKRLASVYKSPDDMDPWVGALAEDHMSGASMGELAIKVIKDQFTRSMHGDPFFYLNEKPFFDSDDIKAVFDHTKFSFSDLLRLNTNIKDVPNNCFINDKFDDRSFPVDEQEDPEGEEPDEEEDDKDQPPKPPSDPRKDPWSDSWNYPTKAPVKNPTQDPWKAPPQDPWNNWNAPVKGPWKETKAPVKAPAKDPWKAPPLDPWTNWKAPTKAPAKAPTKAPTKEPWKAPTKPPKKSKKPSKSKKNMKWRRLDFITFDDDFVAADNHYYQDDDYSDTIPFEPPKRPSDIVWKTLTDPPVAAPKKKPRKQAPTLAPVKPPTKAPTVYPTKAPVKPPTKAPVNPPTKAPVKPPPKGPVKTLTNALTKALVKNPTKTPVIAPTKAPKKKKNILY